MADWLLIIISAIVSLAADLAVDCRLLMKHGVGSKEYRDALKFAHNNKGVVNRQDIIENMDKRLSKLESRINELSGNPNVDFFEISKLKREISSIKSNQIRSSSTTNSQYDATQLYNEINQLKNEINRLNEDIQRLNNAINYQQHTIQTLQNSHRTTPAPTVTAPVVSPSRPAQSPSRPTQPKTVAFTSSKVIIPNKAYVEKLVSNLSTIKNHLGKWEYESYQKGLQQILRTDDFEDGEEIMNDVHELIKKYIYGSDTKVSIDDWQKLEQYIEQAGYIAVPVKAGDNITPYRSYFDRPIPASGGTPNTIKQIQLKPFALTYEDCGEKETLKLCGKCTYFK